MQELCGKHNQADQNMESNHKFEMYKISMKKKYTISTTLGHY